MNILKQLFTSDSVNIVELFNSINFKCMYVVISTKSTVLVHSHYSFVAVEVKV